MASLNIPSDIFTVNNLPVQSRIFVQSIPKSFYNFSYSLYNETRYDDVFSVYPYADLNREFKLDYEYTILSTVLNITADEKNSKGDKIKWSNNIILTILYDFPNKHEGVQNRKKNENNKSRSRYSAMPLDCLKDICLGKLNEETGLWTCVSSSQEALSLDNYQLQSPISGSGIYAVILNPRMNDKKLNIELNFFIQHLLSITITVLILLLIIGIGLYVFSRIYRYRRKYKRTKKAYQDTKFEFSSLEMRTSNIQGETLADQEEGVLFTENPTYKKIKIDETSNVRQLESMYEKFDKKLKTLEKNNRILLEKTENMKNEIQRLKEYRDEMSQPLI